MCSHIYIYIYTYFLFFYFLFFARGVTVWSLMTQSMPWIFSIVCAEGSNGEEWVSLRESKGDITPAPSFLTGLGRINDTWLNTRNKFAYSGMLWGRKQGTELYSLRQKAKPSTSKVTTLHFVFSERKLMSSTNKTHCLSACLCFSSPKAKLLLA